MKRLLPIVLLCLLVSLHLVNLEQATSVRYAQPLDAAPSFVLPPEVLKLASLEFDGLASDYLYLRALVFWGEALERSAPIKLKKREWESFYADLVASTDLDPYFLDPYIFAQGIMTWDGKMYSEVNTLLEKGGRYRDWDWLLPFYRGFNYFYFLNDNVRASEVLMEAAQRPDAIPILASLATRLAVKGGRTESSILFLRQMLAQEEDEALREEFALRLAALEGVLVLERAIDIYQAHHGRVPASLDALVEADLLGKIPPDPYGGRFYLDGYGEIRSTSNFIRQQ